MDAGTCPECGQHCDVPVPVNQPVHTRKWAASFLISGAAVVLLMIAILVSEAIGWQDGYYHLPQLLFTGLCFVSALQYLRTRGRHGSQWITGLAWLALLLTGLWLLFVVFVVVVLTSGTIRFDF